MVMSKLPLKLTENDTGKMILNSQNVAKRHGGILGLCSYVNAHPYDIPIFLPTIVSFLCKYVNDPEPILVNIFVNKIPFIKCVFTVTHVNSNSITLLRYN